MSFEEIKKINKKYNCYFSNHILGINGLTDDIKI